MLPYSPFLCALLLFASQTHGSYDLGTASVAAAGALSRQLYTPSVVESSSVLRTGHAETSKRDAGRPLRRILGKADGSKNHFQLHLTAVVRKKTRQCTWRSRTTQCMLSNTAMAQYLRQTGHPFAKYASNFAECSGVPNKRTCRSMHSCFWDAKAKCCHFREITNDHTNSPCLKQAPFVVGFLAFQWQCSGLGFNSCKKQQMCAWNSLLKRCDFDAFPPLYHVDIEEYNEAILALTPGWLDVFQTTFNTSDPNLDWKQILEWDVPDLPCPERLSPTACALVKIAERHGLSMAYYCVFQYKNASLCNQDALCFYDTNIGICNIKETSLDVNGPFIKGALPFVQNSLDKIILAEALFCHDITERDLCSGSCTWLEKSARCRILDTWAYDKIAEADSTGEDPLCTFFAVTSMSRCSTKKTQRLCTADSTCTWRSRDLFCLPSVEFMASHAFANNSALQEPYEELQSQCQNRKKRRSCHRATQKILHAPL